MVELVRASLYDRTPAEKPEDIDWKDVLELSSRHMVVSMSFDGMNRLERKPEGEIYRKWKEFADKALVKEISFDAERGMLLREFESEGIKYVPLKGIILKQYYRRPGLRQFSDNDILVEKDRIDDACCIMEKSGYTQEDVTDYHKEYLKQPIYNFELHTQLLSEQNTNAKYFEDIWDKVESDGSGYGYKMTSEDFYLFHIIHLEKHFDGSGTGLRYFADQFYLEQKMLAKTDRSSLQQQLEKMNMAEFELKIRGLTSCMFGQSDVSWDKILENSADMQEMFLYVMSCGAYGNHKNLIDNNMKKSGSKLKYAISRLTMEDVYYKRDYPILEKLPWLKPVFVVWRIISAPFLHKEKFMLEMKAIFGRKKKQ